MEGTRFLLGQDMCSVQGITQALVIFQALQEIMELQAMDRMAVIAAEIGFIPISMFLVGPR